MIGGIEVESVEQEKSYSKWEWFLYIILLPCVFTLILVGIILTFMKVDVITPLLEIGNKIPYVGKIIPDPKVNSEEDFFLYENTFREQTNNNILETTGSEEATPMSTEEINRYQQEIADKDMLIVQLENDLKHAEDRMKQMETELEQRLLESKKSTDIEKKEKIKEIADMYSAMTASKSAPILSNLEIHEAAQILAEMDNKKRSQILAKLDPKTAADLSLILATVSEDTDALLQERIRQLEQELEKATAPKKGKE